MLFLNQGIRSQDRHGSVLTKKQQQADKRKRKLERDIEIEEGDDYVLDLHKHYTDIPEEERYDIIPELWEGHNIADYIDPDIFEKLEELEREEELREATGMYVVPKIELDETMQEIKKLALQIRNKKAIMRDEARINKQSRKPVMPRTAGAKVGFNLILIFVIYVFVIICFRFEIVLFQNYKMKCRN